MQVSGERAAPKRSGEVRCKPPKCRAWLRDRMVSAREAGIDLRETLPLPRNILHSREIGTLADTGQRPYPKGGPRLVRHVNQLKGRGRPSGVPCPRSGFRKERLGSEANCHLNDLAACIFVNVGGPYAEVSSPPKKHMGVGGPIVVRARESRVQGKGGQGIDVRWTTNRRSPWESSVEPGYPGRSDERRADDRAVGSRQSLESRVR